MKATYLIVSFAALATTAFAMNRGLQQTPTPQQTPAQTSTAVPAGTVQVGNPAPSFSAVDSNGKAVKLDDFKGKFVVLEWSNFDCPYVQKQYGSHNMQNLQKKYTDKGVVWLTVYSSAAGKNGFYKPEDLNQKATESGMASTVIPDADGALGKLYGAKNTPTMFVIDPTGKTIYMGAIDDSATPDQADVAKAKNYVAAALDEAMAGQPVTTPVTQPYGCAVHYSDQQ